MPFCPPLNLTLDDYLVLKTALSSSVFANQSPLRKQAKSVLAKIEANLGSAVTKDLGKLRDVAWVNVKSTSGFSKLSLMFKLIEQSILNRKSIKLVYGSLQSGQSLRQVDPYSLVYRRHAWYLVGFCHRRAEIRLFRLNRIKKITLLDKSFEKKQDTFCQISSRIAGSFIKENWFV